MLHHCSLATIYVITESLCNLPPDTHFYLSGWGGHVSLRSGNINVRSLPDWSKNSKSHPVTPIGNLYKRYEWATLLFSSADYGEKCPNLESLVSILGHKQSLAMAPIQNCLNPMLNFNPIFNSLLFINNSSNMYFITQFHCIINIHLSAWFDSVKLVNWSNRWVFSKPVGFW